MLPNLWQGGKNLKQCSLNVSLTCNISHMITESQLLRRSNGTAEISANIFAPLSLSRLARRCCSAPAASTTSLPSLFSS